MLRLILGDDQFGAFRDAFGIVYRDAVRAVPLLIGRGEGDEGHINGDDPLIKQPGGLPKEVGGVVSPAFVDRIPAAGAGEQGVVPKVAGHLRLGVFAGAQGQHVDDLHVLIGLVVINHRVDQGWGSPTLWAKATRSPEWMCCTASWAVTNFAISRFSFLWHWRRDAVRSIVAV